MPFLEIVMPEARQEEEARTSFRTALVPALASRATPDAGARAMFYGEVITENGKEVKPAFTPLVAIEWTTPEDFFAIVKTPSFGEFMTIAKPLLLAPTAPEIYEMDHPPQPTLAQPTTHIVRLVLDADAANEPAARAAWSTYVQTLAQTADVEAVSGTSLNLPAGQVAFLGVVGGAIGEAAGEGREKLLAMGAKLWALRLGNAGVKA